MIDSNWDIDSYKTHHESDEHWELRRKFMVSHKERLPEDELVCLAQVFTNIEFLGCRYPNETMMRVAELAKGVVEEFREKKKDTLKRTFVAASDAASSKVKGIKKNKFNIDSKGEKELKPIESYQKKILPPLTGPFSKFVVIITRFKTALQLLERFISINRPPNSSIDYEKTLNGLVECSVTLEGIKLSSAVAADRKTAQDSAASIALEKLREQCYTIVEENELVGQDVQKSDLGVETVKPVKPETTDVVKPEAEPPINNIGNKMMKLMGWAGGGLGSCGQGRLDPVEAVTIVNRAGFGSAAPDPSDQSTFTPKYPVWKFRTDLTNYLKQWLADGAKSDLLFASDFNRELRQVAHKVANNMGLKSRSYGKQDRRLVISKKLSWMDLVQELYEAGGRSDKYQLLKPGEPLPPVRN